MRMPIRLILPAVAVCLVVIGPARAATIDGTFIPIVNGVNDDFNLTELGVYDWALWSQPDGAATGVPTQQKIGASLIDDAYGVEVTTLRGSGATSRPQADFTWTDGDPLLASTSIDSRGIFNTSIDNTGAGVGIEITLPEAKYYHVYIWGAVYAGRAEFEATLAGATTYTNTSLANTDGSIKRTGLYFLEVESDNPGDVLTIEYTLFTDAGSSAHALLVAAAVGVPTPAALPAGLGLMTLALARRKRR